MAVYRQIQITFWQDPFVLELTPEEKYFYIYLMTNSKTSQCGIYELSKRIIEIETGYTLDKINELITKFIKYKKILYCEDTSEIMLLNWIKYNGSNSPKVKSRIEKELKDIKNIEFVNVCLDRLKAYGYSINTVSIQYAKGIDTKSQKEKEKEKKEEEEKEKGISLLSEKSIELCKYYETLKPGQSIAAHIPQLNIFLTDYDFEWCKEAMQKTILNTGKFVPNYMGSILQDWKANGKPEPKKDTFNNYKQRDYDFKDLENKLTTDVSDADIEESKKILEQIKNKSINEGDNH